jgi:hypothetical protein
VKNGTMHIEMGINKYVNDEDHWDEHTTIMLNNQVFLTHGLHRQTSLRMQKDLQSLYSGLQKKLSDFMDGHIFLGTGISRYMYGQQ